MNVSSQAQAVLLLTAHFSKPRPDDAKPLTPTEWGKFALWLKDESLGPETLLSGNLAEKLASWTDKQITRDRIDRLLDRGSALAIAMEKWLRSGLWILTRSDPAYPTRLKQRLRMAAPAVLFGCGNIKLLEQRAIAVVGSRNASDDDLAYARRIGELIAQAGVSVVSGGARGIDEAAMIGTLEAEGTAVGVLADSLLRASSSLRYRKHLLADNLVLVSPFYPEAGFSAGNAMGRNKYIYCLSDAAVVVHSGGTGGTWTGALENLDKGWVRVWVKPMSDSSAGNAQIVQRGGSWLPDHLHEIDVRDLLRGAPDEPANPQRIDLFAIDGRVSEPATAYQLGTESIDGAGTDGGNDTDQAVQTPLARTLVPKEVGFYEFFLLKVREACREKPQTASALEEQFELNKGQLNVWLKKAVKDKKLTKLTKPVRYEWAGDERQRSIF
jgi:predicted Rossmann fold nucleotide-binding protein DprA/Smf involved in DNA uptake